MVANDVSVQLVEVPRLSQRLESFLWKRQFPTLLAELAADTACLLMACDEVKSAKKLPQILKVRGSLVRGNLRCLRLAGERLTKLPSDRADDWASAQQRFVPFQLRWFQAGVPDASTLLP